MFYFFPPFRGIDAFGAAWAPSAPETSFGAFGAQDGPLAPTRVGRKVESVGLGLQHLTPPHPAQPTPPTPTPPNQPLVLRRRVLFGWRVALSRHGSRDIPKTNTLSILRLLVFSGSYSRATKEQCEAQPADTANSAFFCYENSFLCSCLAASFACFREAAAAVCCWRRYLCWRQNAQNAKNVGRGTSRAPFFRERGVLAAHRRAGRI